MTDIIHSPSWTPAQQARLAALLEAQSQYPDVTWVGYWNSDAWGRSANGGGHHIEKAAPGVIHRLDCELGICGPNGLHATRQPHRWQGARVWVVALLGKRIDHEEKSSALMREIIGEVMPEDVICPMVAARMGIARANLVEANLARANLARANLAGANLVGANLNGANLIGANLVGANLDGANLDGANLDGANLAGADLTRANLAGANLVGASLDGASLDGASLDGASLTRANLAGANLVEANLARASLTRANLAGANLNHVYIGTIARPIWLSEQWIVTADGYIARREV